MTPIEVTSASARQSPDRQRRYDASRRRQAARERRQQVLAAAAASFVERGYAGSTMGDIATRAGVSIKTVEAAFGTKAALLKVVVDVAIAGDDEPVAVVDRPIVERLREESDPERFLELYAAMVTEISERLAPLVGVVEQAASGQPEIAELWTTMLDNRLFGARHMAGLLSSKTTLRPDVDGDAAADILFLFNDPAVYRTMVILRGWSQDAFRRWLASTYRDLLLDR